MSRRCVLAVAMVAGLIATSSSGGQAPRDVDVALPSWNDGAVKRAIVDFVARVTKEGGPDFVPMADRIATFDNDGTLWVEKPLPNEVYFVLARIRQLAATDPTLRTRQPFKAALEGDTAYFHENGAKAALELLVKSHGGMSQDTFVSEVETFLGSAQHPTLRRPLPATAYQPMLELLTLLKANGFDVWICSGGTSDFMRAFAPATYGIPVDHIIGSDITRDSRIVDGRRVIWRLAELGILNDKEMKPVTIDRHIGKRPILVGGNVGGSGDIAMMEYSKGRRGPSLQLLVNHDDAAREFAYVERDGYSLATAKAKGFTVVSIKDDWKTVLR